MIINSQSNPDALFDKAIGKSERKFDLIGFFKEHWKGITAGIIVFVIVASLFVKIGYSWILKKRVGEMEKELVSIGEMIKNAQID